MSAIFIEKIKAWINYVHSTPISEHGMREELLAWAGIVGVMAVIWLIGELVYRWEERRDG